MMIFIDIKRLVQLFFIFIGAIAIYVFYKTFGLNPRKLDENKKLWYNSL